jgi:hypothetical protein
MSRINAVRKTLRGRHTPRRDAKTRTSRPERQDPTRWAEVTCASHLNQRFMKFQRRRRTGLPGLSPLIPEPCDHPRMIAPGRHASHIDNSLLLRLRAAEPAVLAHRPGDHPFEPRCKILQVAALVDAVRAVTPGRHWHATAFTTSGHLTHRFFSAINVPPHLALRRACVASCRSIRTGSRT